MKKIIATIAAAGLLLAGGAATASAETLTRARGASKVTIYPWGSPPAGAEVLDARVTVKKGSKTVARNKKTYRAKKGKYRVTSTVTYYVPGFETTLPDTLATVPVMESDMSFEQCTVTGRTLTNRTVQVTDYSSYWREGTVRGQAAITYTGNCTAEIESLGYIPHAWVDDWTEIVSVFETGPMSSPTTFDVNGWLNGELARNSSVLYPSLVGDVVHYPGNGAELDRAGTITATIPGETVWTPATPRTTSKHTRTVTVR